MWYFYGFTGTDTESLWSPPASCEHCHVTHPLEFSKLDPDLLMVLIHAKADEWKRREAIRQTWVSDFVGMAHSPVKYRFVVAGKGLPMKTVGLLLREAQRHRDIIILPYVTDSHVTLTQRTIEGFKYAVENFKFSYVLKCDDDTYVDLPRVASELQLRERRDRLYWGYMLGTSRPQSLGRYRETHWVLCNSYFPYALGGGYVLSRDLVDILSRVQSNLIQYRCEDVSVGAWLAPYNIERRHDVRFDTESRSRGCKEVFLVSHKVSVENMLNMYQSLQLEGTFCSWRTHWHTSNGYLYNWSALPSQCCTRHTGIP